jgi:hypothetical protein
MTQRETILRMLEEAGDRGVTGNTFYANFLPRFPARIHELKKQGHNIQRFPTEEPNVFLYRLVKVSITTTQTDPSLCVRAVNGGADLGQSPNTPERQRNRQVADVAGESSTTSEATSSSPQPREAAAVQPRQVTDADGSPGRDPSASLLLFDMPARLYEDAA